MTDANDTENRPGAATPGAGTPVAVDVSGDARARGTIALFLAGPVIWTGHFLLIYLVAEAGCTGSGPGLRVFDPPVPTTLTLVATVVAALACLALSVASYRRWRTDRHSTHDEVAAGPDRSAGLALAGSALSLLGFVTVVFVGLPAVVLPAC